MKCTDINSANIEVKIWGVDLERDLVYVDRVYVAKLKYDETWGFSTNGTSSWKIMS